MKFKHNVFNFVTASTFVLAFLCLMISYATYFMFYPSMLFFEAGFVMLTIILTKSYLAKNDDVEQKQEAIVMELASGDDGETYVMQDEKQDKKSKQKRRNQRFEKMLPIILSSLVCILFIYLFINAIVSHL